MPEEVELSNTMVHVEVGGAGPELLASLPRAEQDLVRGYQKCSEQCKALCEGYHIGASEFTRQDRVGEGVVGTVYKGKWRGSFVAIKDLKQGYSTGSMAHEDLLKELEIWSKLRHPNIVCFMGACMSAASPAILCELMDGGSLEQVFVEKRRKLHRPWKPPRLLVHTWALHLCQALAYMHGFAPPIVHRDVKPANLLLSADLMTLKLSDLGLARRRPHGACNMTGNTGTKRYMAPEVFRSDKTYGTPVDVYSAAMIMWQMYMGQRPYETVLAEEVASRASEQELRPPASEIAWREYRDLIVQAWSADPAQRPTAQSLVNSLQNIGGRPSQPSQNWVGCGSLGCMMACWGSK
mmetsp:Transcript_28595/g.70770  ORF Transcript_28595/g.70770 Transcript_28595/m.70770 type:complete len:351 (-) Transcript_28595:284-1336(-)